jgi:translation initiation factor 1A
MCGKMRKKKFVHTNDIVLVSIREWQDGICDIIDNYDVNLARKLKDKGLVPKSINLDVDNQYSSDDDDNLGIVFSTNLPDSSDDEKLEKVDSDETETDEDIDVADI